MKPPRLRKSRPEKAMELISSRTNEQVKQFVRVREGTFDNPLCFAVEGAKLLAEVARSEHAVLQVFVVQGYEDKVPAVAAHQVFAVTPEVMHKLSGLRSPSWVVAVCSRKPSPGPDRVLRRTPWLVLDGVQDPGNVGSILRSAEALGNVPVVLLPPAPSPFQEKVIRASMGSALRAHYWRPPSAEEFLAEQRARGVTLWALDRKGEVVLADLPAEGERAFVVGGEGHGLSGAVAAAVERTVRIPIRGQVESLNAAAAAAILLYHLGARKREPR
jgi:TrmH family RNA methyltransferase